MEAFLQIFILLKKKKNSKSNRLGTDIYICFLFFHIELTLLMWTSIIIIMSCKVTFQAKFTKVSNYSIFGHRHICLCLLSYGDVPSYYTNYMKSIIWNFSNYLSILQLEHRQGVYCSDKTTSPQRWSLKRYNWGQFNRNNSWKLLIERK